LRETFTSAPDAPRSIIDAAKYAVCVQCESFYHYVCNGLWKYLLAALFHNSDSTHMAANIVHRRRQQQQEKMKTQKTSIITLFAYRLLKSCFFCKYLRWKLNELVSLVAH
jgi:hypothetical protein